MASIFLAFGTVLAVLSALHPEAQGARMIANLTNTSHGHGHFTSQSPLVPGLDTTEPTIYELSELKWGLHYKAKLVMSGSTMANESKSDKDFALQFEGKPSSHAFGQNTMQVTDPSTGKELFKVRASRHNFNPIEWVGRFSYRILPPGSNDAKDSIFTINKDYIGLDVHVKGLKEVWRIYRGRKRDGHLAYYCVSSYTFWDGTKCYNSEEEYKKEAAPVLKLHTKFWDPYVFGGNWWGIANELPDAQYLTMRPEADPALFLAFGVILDTTHSGHS